MDINSAPTVVPLGDTRSLHVPIENQPQPAGNREDQSVWRETHRDGFACFPCRRLKSREFIIQPSPEVGSEVVANRHRIPLAVLLAGGTR